MLVKCPECELQISDKAPICPHCGYPQQLGKYKRTVQNRQRKHRRLPNGFGQISEIKNRHLRKPFRAMISVGKDANGRPICRPLKPEAYFLTYNDAYAALMEYNKNPCEPEPSLTVRELFGKWFEEYKKNVREPRGATAAWKYCSSVYDMQVRDLRARHIKACIDEGQAGEPGHMHGASAVTKNQIKSLFNQMLDYAVEYELAERNYARTFTLTADIHREYETTKNEHVPFTDEEISLLWEHAENDPTIETILIQCYSGWRPQELGLIELETVDLENWTFRGGIKTEAGTNRTVPIHSRIRALVLHKYQEAKRLGSPYLINYTSEKARSTNTQLTYSRYTAEFAKIRDRLQLNPIHRPHDGRKHFVTMAKRCGVDEYAIKYMVGHAISDITEKVYTHREFEWLREEIEKIK